jgi:hypothetical protein
MRASWHYGDAAEADDIGREVGWPFRHLPKVATEMALHVLAYNLTRVMNILGVKPLIAAIQT